MPTPLLESVRNLSAQTNQFRPDTSDVHLPYLSVLHPIIQQRAYFNIGTFTTDSGAPINLGIYLKYIFFLVFDRKTIDIIEV